MSKLRELIKSERGISLIEVVASIVIIGIILISFFGLFINSAKFNSNNDTNIQATNIVREYAANFNKKYDNQDWGVLVLDFVKDPNKPGDYIKTYTQGNYYIEVRISEQKEVGDFYKELRKVYIAAWEGTKSGKLLSETYTFHEGVI